MDKGLHELLWSLVEKDRLDYEPYGQTVREGADCSCGCKWFLKLEKARLDWGVCSNSKSHRAGKLTFEHQGCMMFELDEELNGEIDRMIKENEGKDGWTEIRFDD